MKRTFLFLALLSAAMNAAQAQQFDDYFDDRTLRLDYTFSGDSERQELYVDELVALPRWYGKRHRLAEVPLKGNGQLTVREKASGQVIYRHSFSTLFQEWLATEESRRTPRSFENTFLVPFPKQPVDITVELWDYHMQTTARLTHSVNPRDILIRKAGERLVTPYVTLQQAADTARCIHIAYVAEGYQQQEMPTFLDDCRTAMEALFGHEPFKEKRPCFNIVAVMPPSAESGTSWPAQGIWRNTALGSHFDTFYSDRYLTTLQLKRMHNLLAGIPYEHIIILANTDTYGGGGIFNSYTLTTAHHASFRPVVVHEFGHSFGGLADEYAYDDQYEEQYFPGIEPWEQNITTLADFGSKWESMVGQEGVGLIEGAGYQSKGVWRATEDCRMRTNAFPDFCPVCAEAIRKMVRFYTGE